MNDTTVALLGLAVLAALYIRHKRHDEASSGGSSSGGSGSDTTPPGGGIPGIGGVSYGTDLSTQPVYTTMPVVAPGTAATSPSDPWGVQGPTL